ncbi:MAG: hypothetical protein ACKV1O_26495 [Saprospiraceae bacterium]
MRTLLLAVILLFLSAILAAQKDTLPVGEIVHPALLDEQPQFPGGGLELLKFINSKIRILAICDEMYGTVSILQFTIDATGYPMDLKIKRLMHPCFQPTIDEVWADMPCWIPGKKNGKPVSTTFTFPIRIHLE